MAKLRARLAKTPDAETDRLRQIEQMRGKLAEVEQQYQTAAGNLALATCPETFAAIEPKVKELAARKLQLASEIETLESSQSSTITPHESVDAAVDLLGRLPTLAEDPENLGSIGRLFQQIDLQVFLRFQSVRKTKRTVNQLSGGILTIGAVSAPIEKYAGPTGRRALETSVDR